MFNNTLPRSWNFDNWSVLVPSPSLPHCVIALSQYHNCHRDNWAKTSAKNKDLNVFVGAPASQDAGAHYVTADQMGQIIAGTRNGYASFGGVMLWDAYAAKCECVHVNLKELESGRVEHVLLRSTAFSAWGCIAGSEILTCTLVLANSNYDSMP